MELYTILIRTLEMSETMVWIPVACMEDDLQAVRQCPNSIICPEYVDDIWNSRRHDGNRHHGNESHHATYRRDRNLCCRACPLAIPNPSKSGRSQLTFLIWPIPRAFRIILTEGDEILVEELFVLIHLLRDCLFLLLLQTGDNGNIHLSTRPGGGRHVKCH